MGDIKMEFDPKYWPWIIAVVVVGLFVGLYFLNRHLEKKAEKYATAEKARKQAILNESMKNVR